MIRAKRCPRPLPLTRLRPRKPARHKAPRRYPPKGRKPLTLVEYIHQFIKLNPLANVFGFHELQRGGR